MVAEQQHIDYQFRGLEDECTEDDDDNGYGYDGNDDGELSFDYGQNDQAQEVVALSRSSMEGNLSENQMDFIFNRRRRVISQSAPILADKVEATEKINMTRPSPTRKSNTYVLPTPDDAQRSPSPSRPRKPAKDIKDEKLSPARIPKPQSVLKESNVNNSGPIKLPLPLADRPVSQLNVPNTSDTKTRQAYSGNLNSKHHLSVSPNASPPPVPSPRISELHELPRPPSSSERPTRPSSLVGHSAPLVVSRGRESHAAATKRPAVASQKASPLPTPPVLMARSFSIPSSHRQSIIADSSQ